MATVEEMERDAKRSTELDAVRRRLEDLASSRLAAPFDEEVQREYEALCRREEELLRSLRAP